MDAVSATLYYRTEVARLTERVFNSERGMTIDHAARTAREILEVSGIVDPDQNGGSMIEGQKAGGSFRLERDEPIFTPEQVRRLSELLNEENDRSA